MVPCSADPSTLNSIPAPERIFTLLPVQRMYCADTGTGLLGVLGLAVLFEELFDELFDELLDELLDELFDELSNGEDITFYLGGYGDFDAFCKKCAKQYKVLQLD